MMNEIKIWINKGKESEKTAEYQEAGTFNIDIKYRSNLSSNIRGSWYKLGVKKLSAIYEDLYLISLVVFAVDKRVPRSCFSDAWTRTLKINMPVKELGIWNSVKSDIDRMLSYLSGDKWDINFRECEPKSDYKSPRKRSPKTPEFLKDIKAVSLFSGGLDSFCGAHKLLGENIPTVFVGFQEYGKLKGLQNKLMSSLQETYPDCYSSLFTFSAVARSMFFNDDTILNTENTSRSRSFLFLCSALVVAGIVGDEIPVYIPENGFIGLNLPMTPSRIGSCSTRTTHPYFIKMFNEILEKIGINHKIVNPYAFSTKREMVNQFKNIPSFQKYFHETISCSHPCNGRWDRYPVPQNCGYCYPCLIRQSSLLDVDLTNESYGKDIFTSDYIRQTTDAKHSDLVDLLSSIITADASSDIELKRRIAMTGKLTADEVERFLRLYKSTILDLKQLLSKSEDYSKLIGD